MEFSVLRLLFDFGLVVLIWLVQLIIYPSFRYMDGQKLLFWHSKYSTRISLVVMPLMLGQLLITVLQLNEGSVISYIIALLVLMVWILTFLYFVPLHNKISRDRIDDRTLYRLVSLNWWRTVIWTVIFVLALSKAVIY